MKKNSLIIASSILGLTIAATSVAAISSAPTAQVMDNGKPALVVKSDRGEHKGWDKDGKHGDHKGMKDGMGKGGMMGGLQELNLTDTQKAQLEQLRTANQAKMQQFKTQLDSMDKNIATQKAAGASTSTLLGLYQQKQSVMDQFFAMHQQQRQQFVNILTPEQQLKMYESQGRDHDAKRGGDHDRDGMRKPPMPMGVVQK